MSATLQCPACGRPTKHNAWPMETWGKYVTDHELDRGADELEGAGMHVCECGEAVWIDREETRAGDEGGGRWYLAVRIPSECATDNRGWSRPGAVNLHAPQIRVASEIDFVIIGCSCGFSVGTYDRIASYEGETPRTRQWRERDHGNREFERHLREATAAGAPGAFVWRPELTADDVADLVEALGAITRDKGSLYEVDDAPRLSALRDRLSNMRGTR